MGLLSRAAKMIRAYHGSPHDFDAFEYSPRTALTGEGAAAFGPGLYFAEKESVAQGYRDALSGISRPILDGQTLNLGDVDFAIMQAGRTVAPDIPQRQLDLLSTNIVEAIRMNADPQQVVAALAKTDKERVAAEAMLSVAKGVSPSPPGKMYEVGLKTSADELIDWDTSLATQSPAVRAAADELFKGDWQAWNPRGAELVSGVWNDARKTQDTGVILDVLKDKGLKGTRFLDQGSRGPGDWRILKPTESTSGKWVAGYAPNGPNRYFDTEEELAKYVAAEEAKRTRNYAIWDDKIIDILRKYGLPIGATGATGGLLSRTFPQQEMQTA